MLLFILQANDYQKVHEMFYYNANILLRSFIRIEKLTRSTTHSLIAKFVLQKHEQDSKEIILTFWDTLHQIYICTKSLAN